ncbi:hypothetical protein NDK47_23300 [Brevibacillus ruminantium]|uniref:PepSY domain-containing protein n=1 Tax=Brevibacillus ruminantium TaxID=2950604 RepID=A0ABY4WD73_9BACL|nr:hypothetical protein [Brevibacillus ruminantium]USG65017.1 hypothetical protein NDK47_23300 [Brevibacillus ruminantium]
MGLSNDEDLIQMLRQIKQEARLPRQDWKRIGKERLIRQARGVQRKSGMTQFAAYIGTIAVAALMGLWINKGYMVEKIPQRLPQTYTAQTIAEPSSAMLSQEQKEGQEASAAAPPVEPLESVEKPTAGGKLAAGESPAAQETGMGSLPTEHTVQTGEGVVPNKTVDATPRRMTALEEQAQRYLREKLGEQGKDYEIDPAHSRQPEGYIAFRRLVQGIPLQQSSAVVEINPDNGKISLLLYPEVEKPRVTPQTPVIDRAAAAQKLASTLGLVYAGKEHPVLQYRIDPDAVVDAKTGELLVSREEKRVASVRGEGKKLIVKDAGTAAQVMQQEFGIEVKGEAFMTIDEQGLSFNWSLGENRRVRLKTTDDGSFIGYSLEGSFQPAVQSKSSLQQAEKIALAGLAKYLPANVDQVLVKSAGQNQGQATFLFAPMYQGVPVLDESYKVAVEMTSGMVTRIEGDFSQSSFVLPDKAQALPLKDAAAQFVQNVPLELVYWAKDRNEPVLVYQIRQDTQQPWAIEALTGKID